MSGGNPNHDLTDAELGTTAHAVLAHTLTHSTPPPCGPIDVPDDTGHSRFSASSAGRWMACPASVRLVGTLPPAPPRPSLKARAHCTPEITGALSPVLDYIRERQLTASDTWVERRFNLTQYHPEIYGTADVVMLFPDAIEILDLKFGSGVLVTAAANDQLRQYALGAYEELGRPSAVTRIRLTIAQPRLPDSSGEIIRWVEIQPRDLLDWGQRMLTAAYAAGDPAQEPYPGGHCRWCPAKRICPALEKNATAMAVQAFTPPAPTDAAELSRRLRMIPAVEAYISALREYAYQEAEAGRAPPGFKLVPKRAVRRWNPDVTATTLALEFGCGPERFLSTPELLTPAKVEEQFKVKGDREALATYVERVSTGHNLVPVEEPGEAVNTSRRTTDAKEAFRDGK